MIATYIDSYMNGSYRRTITGELVKKIQHSGHNWGIVVNKETLKNGVTVTRHHMVNMGRIGDVKKRWDPKVRFPQNGVVKKPSGKALREKRV